MLSHISSSSSHLIGESSIILSLCSLINQYFLIKCLQQLLYPCRRNNQTFYKSLYLLSTNPLILELARGEKSNYY